MWTRFRSYYDDHFMPPSSSRGIKIVHCLSRVSLPVPGFELQDGKYIKKSKSAEILSRIRISTSGDIIMTKKREV